MVLSDRQYQYNIISLALDAARSNVAQGLTKKINTLTVLTLDTGTISVRLNSASNDSIPLADNMKIEGLPISEIYWTSAISAGKTAKIFAVWID